MTELVINGRAASMKDGISLKLNVANPYFTDNDAYTYDIDLPLGNERNRRIFGHIHRFDVAKKKKTYPARLIVDNIEVLSGTAVITSVTETSVKVQLMGERTAYNYDSTANKRYIDTLQLGMFTGEIGVFNDNPPSDNSEEENRGLHSPKPTTHGTKPCYEDPQGRWLEYPILNTTTGLASNDYCIYETELDREIPDIGFPPGVTIDSSGNFDYRKDRRAFQPMLWWVCQKIAQATGYTLDKNDNAIYIEEKFRKIFIAAAFPTFRLNLTLPHWTVSEFWANLQKAFGVMVTVSGNRMRILRRSVYYTSESEIQEIKDAEDSYNCDVDDDDSTDISSSNVAFASFEHDPCDLLESTVTETARVDSSFKDIEDIRQWAKSLASYRLDDFRDTLFKCKDGRDYIYFKERFGSPAFVQVNQYAARITDIEEDENQIEIKFVPCTYHEHEIPVLEQYLHLTDPNIIRWRPTKTSHTVEILGRPDREDFTDCTTILEDIIAGDPVEQSEGSNVIYMGIKNGYSELSSSYNHGMNYNFDYPNPNCRERWKWDIESDTVSCEHQGDSLGLNKNTGSANIGSSTLENGLVIDTSVKMCVKFLADKIPDPTTLFNIRNRLFACEKIEATIKNSGLQRMLTGYFFPVDL